MSGNRKLSIGITVNLENYENLKVEVEGDAPGESEAEELIDYLDSVLSRLGRSDPETRKKIDSYRRRVLEKPGGYTLTGVSETPRAGEAGIFREDAPLQEIDIDAPAPARVPAETASAAGEKALEDTGFTCSACSRPISKAEEQLSQIFMGRSLCRKCLDEMQK